MEERIIDYWAAPGTEVLIHEDIDEAIEAILDDWYEDVLPEEIDVYGFSRMKVTFDPEDILESIVTNLDEEYGDPDGHWSDMVTSKMEEASREFARILTKEYKPWACEEVEKVKVDVQSWVKENRPDWLENEK